MAQGRCQHLETTGEIPPVRAVQEVVNPGVLRVAAAEHSLCLCHVVAHPGPVEVQHRDQETGVVTQCQDPAPLRGLPSRIIDVESHRNRPQCPVAQTHPVADGYVIDLVQEFR